MSDTTAGHVASIPASRASGEPPILVVVQGTEQRTLTLDATPFTVGRNKENHLVIADGHVSRNHAGIILENGEFFLVDNGSRHGTFVNGERVERHKLKSGDQLYFGALRGGAYVIFDPGSSASTSATHDFLSQIAAVEVKRGASDLEKLSLFLEAAHKLNTTRMLDDVLATVLEAALKLTGAERGFVFLKGGTGQLNLAAGRNSKGQVLTDDKTISRSIMTQAATADSSFLITDTTKTLDLAEHKSIVAHELRTVICIPLRKKQIQQKEAKAGAPAGADISGVLYLDSRFASKDISKVGQDILDAMANEAASLVENARLVQAEETARLEQQELAIAATIQQQLMTMTMPEMPFVSIHARNVCCKQSGGDFYDLVPTDEGISVVIADVSGKGIPAAMLASICQGMVHSHFLAKTPLEEIAAAVNGFLCQKSLEKYVTAFLAKLDPQGGLEYLNCGHVPPVVVGKDGVRRLSESNVPVGLLEGAAYQKAAVKMQSGDRLVLVTDGVTEAEDPDHDFFGDERMEQAAASGSSFEDLFTAVHEFCKGQPLSDDCTIVELTYRG
ncbi:MAG: SpoIIE family protein phosphatase [Terriglobales bacterium]